MRLFAVLCCAFLCSVSAESMLVSVQSQSQQDMDTITAAVDEDAHDPNGSMRMTLGAIEATMSRVVDVDSPYFQHQYRLFPRGGCSKMCLMIGTQGYGRSNTTPWQRILVILSISSIVSCT